METLLDEVSEFLCNIFPFFVQVLLPTVKSVHVPSSHWLRDLPLFISREHVLDSSLIPALSVLESQDGPFHRVTFSGGPITCYPVSNDCFGDASHWLSRAIFYRNHKLHAGNLDRRLKKPHGGGRGPQEASRCNWKKLVIYWYWSLDSEREFVYQAALLESLI